VSTTLVATPTSRLRAGHARLDQTPPVGIYHRMWGAARQDRATSIHRPLYGDVLALAPLAGDQPPVVRVYLDQVGFAPPQHARLVAAVAEAAATPAVRVVLTYSHTHAGGMLWPDRIALPGGDLIPPFLERLERDVAAAARQAVAGLTPATITYATGRCAMAANRDYWDEVFGGYVCGYAPDVPADDTLLLARITSAGGDTIATLVNYACHPTTLAWDNTAISPDFVGSLRDEVERATGAPCVYAQGACGDLGPRHGFLGDPAIADQNGRQVAYATLAALATMGPPLMDFHYAGPVISGATVGVWEYRPAPPERLADTARFDARSATVDLALPPLPTSEALRQAIADWEARTQDADRRGDAIAARDAHARAERARRWLGRLRSLPAGPHYPFPFTVHRLGDALWISVGGEPYNWLQTMLRQRFPHWTIVLSPLAGSLDVGYLLPADRYGRGLYQEEATSLQPGGLEALAEAIVQQILRLEET
jgi:hypothetical protein